MSHKDTEEPKGGHGENNLETPHRPSLLLSPRHGAGGPFCKLSLGKTGPVGFLDKVAV